MRVRRIGLMILLLSNVIGIGVEQVLGCEEDIMAFWSTQRVGANCQNRDVEAAYWEGAHAAGLDFIRLLPDGWKSESRDFLLGNADQFEGLVEDDLERLISALDDAEEQGMKVVLTMLSLPGARWRQNNEGQDDGRLWRDERFHHQAAAFWRELADALKGHPAVVAYNPLNEPHPERAFGFQHSRAEGLVEWRQESRGGAADLNVFYARLIEAIRSVDAHTPILLDGSFYASPEGMGQLRPVDDPAVLYAFHFYEPWEYVTYRVNKNRFVYPGAMPSSRASTPTEVWTRKTMAQRVDAVDAWCRKHRIDTRRVIASEFGVDRRVAGAAAYLRDAIALFNERGHHWAFYAFRGDGAWGGLDYELGTDPLPGRFWKAVEERQDPELLKTRGPNPLWNVIRTGIETVKAR